NSINNGATIQNDSVTVTITDTAGNSSSQTHKAPAGVAGQPINLGLLNPSDAYGDIVISIKAVPLGWTLNGGTQNADGSWTVTGTNLASFTVTTPDDFVGARLLNITHTW